ncbi:MAG: LacI family DNA-binding transcriptional regulator [Roseiflexaceae bacterium]
MAVRERRAKRSAPGLKDVAAHAGVSVATVSRVINGGPYITERVQALVLASMQALGYEPHALAQSLRTGQTQSIGYVVSDIANFLFSTIARGIDDTLQPQTYTMVLATSRSDPEHEIAVIRHLQRRRVDGLILSLADETNSQLNSYLAKQHVPLVLLDRDLPGLAADRVVVDHASGITAAVEHLLQLGHRRIGLITGTNQTRPGREIRQAFEHACQAHALITPPEYLAVGPPSEAFGLEALKRMLALPQPPSAIIAGGAQISIGVLYALRQHSITLPTQLSLIAYDDTDATELYTPSICVVARDVYAIGQVAASLLLERLQDPQRPYQTQLIPTQLIIRGSTGAAS